MNEKLIASGSGKTAEEIIRILIIDSLSLMPLESLSKTIPLTPVIQSLPTNGMIYKIMDSVCADLISDSWNCYYTHYYTFVSTCYLTVSRGKLDNNSVFKYFKPYAEEYKFHNEFLPSHPAIK